MSLNVQYYSFNPERADERWKNFLTDFVNIKTSKKSSSDVENDLYNLAFDDSANDEFIILVLKVLDLHYGSVYCSPSEHDKITYDLVQALAQAGDLQFLDGILSKEDWLKLFTMISTDFLAKASVILKTEMDWEVEECQHILFDFLTNVRPVVRDLKERQSSVFVCTMDDVIIPDSVEQLLTERMKEHLKVFRGLEK